MLFIYPAVIHDNPEILSNSKEAMELYVLGLLENSIPNPDPTRAKALKTLDENTFPTLIESNIDLAKNSKSVKKLKLAKKINFSQSITRSLNFKNYLNNKRANPHFPICSFIMLTIQLFSALFCVHITEKKHIPTPLHSQIML
jgi:hypothetical protein